MPKREWITLEHEKSRRRIRWPAGLEPTPYGYRPLPEPKPIEPGTLAVDPKRRRQNFTFDQFVQTQCGPSKPGFCACGCNQALTGRQRRWLPKHVDPILERFFIQKGDSSAIRKAVYRRDRGICAGCGCLCRRADGLGSEFRGREWTHITTGPKAPGWLPSWQADHIHPVAHGGGGCGLENFQLLCDNCHKAKTAAQAAQKARRRIVQDEHPSFL